VREFVKWSIQRIWDLYKPDTTAGEPGIDIIGKCHDIIAGYTDARKRVKLFKSFDALMDTERIVTTESQLHVKRELTFGKDWPRAIIAREAGLRVLSAAAYDYVQLQVYKDKHMIKGMNDTKIIPTIADRMGRFEHHLCIDISSYDSAQRGCIWDIEAALFERILGSEWRQIWCAIT